MSLKYNYTQSNNCYILISIKILNVAFVLFIVDNDWNVEVYNQFYYDLSLTIKLRLRIVPFINYNFLFIYC